MDNNLLFDIHAQLLNGCSQPQLLQYEHQGSKKEVVVRDFIPECVGTRSRSLEVMVSFLWPFLVARVACPNLTSNYQADIPPK